MEKDDEVKGSGNSYTTEFRQYDSRLGRWLSLDPKRTAWESPYASMGNNPLKYKDPLGDTIVISIIIDEAGQITFKLASSEIVQKQVNDGVFILIAHTSPAIIENDTQNDFNPAIRDPKEVFKLLEKNRYWQRAIKEKKQITLILAGCNNATQPEIYYGETPDAYTCDKPIAEQLSIEKPEITIKGVEGYATFGYMYEKKVGSIGTVGKYGLINITKERYQQGESGSWVTYKGGRQINKVEFGSTPKTENVKQDKPTTNEDKIQKSESKK